MTPADLRAAIASARSRTRMYGETPQHFAAYLSGLIFGAHADPVSTAPTDAWVAAWGARS